MSGTPERYCKTCGCRCHCYAPECPNCANDVCYKCECKDDDIQTWKFCTWFKCCSQEYSLQEW